jgi:diguanylate cyclase (GGDEF)-like protein
MKEFLKATNQASYNWNMKDDILVLSDEWFEITGMDRDYYRVSNQEWLKRIHPEDLAKTKATLQAHFKGESQWFQVVYRFWSDTKRWIWIEDCGQVVDRDQEGNPVRMTGFNRDVTKVMREKRVLEETNEMLQLAADVSGLLVYRIDPDDGMVRFHGGSRLENLFFEKEEITLKDFLSRVLAVERGGVEEAFQNLRRKKMMEVQRRFRMLDQNRRAHWVEASVRWSGEGFMIGILRDVDVEARRMIELDRLANRDLMTGLFNRNVFERKINGFTSTIEDQVIAICDVDGLKILNDAFGHLMGDKMLRLFAVALDQVFEGSDLIARIGGDEFVILDRRSVEEMEEKFRVLKTKMNDFDLPVQVGVSYGIAEMNATQDSALAYKKAEDRMYRYKHFINFKMKQERAQKLLDKMQAKDPLTHAHGTRLEKTINDFARDLPMEINEKRELALLARFHDIGKLNVPEEVLKKTSRLTNKEKIEIKRHPEIGYRIARSMPELAGIAHEVLTHHERWDGKGYPLKLKGEEIPYKVRVMALFDYFDSLTHDRPYRPAVDKETALNRIAKSAGKRFDPDLTKRFIDYMQKH